MLGCLLGGAILAYASYAVGPYQDRVSRGGQLKEFRDINPSEHPVYEEVDVENFSRITILTQTLEPPNSSATVTHYQDQGGGRKSQMRDIESVANVWARWDTKNSSKHLGIIASTSARPGAIPATKVEILVCLSAK